MERKPAFFFTRILAPVAFFAGCATDITGMKSNAPGLDTVRNGSISAHSYPCSTQGSAHGKVISTPPQGPWPWGKTIIYAGVTPVLIDIEHCGNISGSGNIPFMLVVYGKKEGFFGEPPVVIKQVLQRDNTKPPFVPRIQATGYTIEAWGIMPNLTSDYAYFLDPVPVSQTEK